MGCYREKPMILINKNTTQSLESEVDRIGIENSIIEEQKVNVLEFFEDIQKKQDDGHITQLKDKIGPEVLPKTRVTTIVDKITEVESKTYNDIDLKEVLLKKKESTLGAGEESKRDSIGTQKGNSKD